MIIRKVKSEDIYEIAQMEKRCFKIPWSLESLEKDIEENAFSFYIVCEIDGRLAGYAALWCIGIEGHITTVAVDAEYRSQGVGKKILNSLLEMTRKIGIVDYTLEVRASNKEALGLYKNFGFKEAGRRPKYYEDNKEDAIVMWRKGI